MGLYNSRVTCLCYSLAPLSRHDFMFKGALPALFLLLVPVCIFTQVAEAPPQQKTAGDIYKMAGPSVVLIETYGDDGKVTGSGSGFLM